jgi:transposase
VSTVSIPDDLELQPVALRHLPLLRYAIDRLGIRAVIDAMLPPDRRAEVSDGDCVTVMIANILAGRVALYNMGQWLAATDVGVLLWEGCPESAFGDDRLGKALDSIWQAGTDNIVSAIAARYLTTAEASHEYLVLTDTTTLSLEGAYVLEGYDREGAPVPKHGHSKDLRPDLKQVVYGLSLHGAAGLPVCASVLDGNTSDHDVNRLHIDKLAALLPPEDEVTLVADCKFADAETLGKAWRTGFHYVTLLPRSFHLREALVEEVRRQDVALAEVGRYPGRTKADPERVYRATSFTRAFPVRDPVGDIVEQVPHRFLVVESSQLALAHEAGVPGDLERDAKAVRGAFHALEKTNFGCADDARRAMGKAAAKATLHVVEGRVVEVEETLKRARRGRPRVGEQAPTRMVWRVVLTGLAVDEDAVERARFHARHFVLLTDHLDHASWPDRRIFDTYHAQNAVEGHTGFRWLKGPAAVAPVFLKLPHRIAALGMVFLLALMVRNWIQARVRAGLSDTGGKLPNMNDRPTATPTTECVFRLFQHVGSVLIRNNQASDTVAARKPHGLTDLTQQVLDLLGTRTAIYWTPRGKSWEAG